MNALEYGSAAAKDLLAPLLREWVLGWPAPAEGEAGQIRAQNLTRTLTVLLHAQAADGPIADACETAFTGAPFMPEGLAFLRGLATCDLPRAIKAIRTTLNPPHGLETSRGQRWMAMLFGVRHSGASKVPLSKDAGVLRDLVVLTYECVRLADDRTHDSGEVYDLDDRDEAESARNAAISTLIDLPGESAYDALCVLADNPLLAHATDRLRYQARERAAIDSAPPPLTV